MRKIGFWAQVAITYFIVSGGPYGLESAVAAVGATGALLLVLLVPLVWALPTSLVVAELSSMMPDSGGYYVWVRKALGPFWGFQEGWWTLCYSAVDLAIYPVLFITYLSFFWPELAQTDSHLRWVLVIAFVTSGIVLNLRGGFTVGRFKLIEILLVLLPFVGLVIVGLHAGSWDGFTAELHNFRISQVAPLQWSTAMAVLLWNYAGWDNVSTYAGEVENPAKTLPKSVLVCLGLVTLTYVLPLVVGYRASVDPKVWGETSGWPEIAKQLVGEGLLATAIAVVAVLSAWALFNSQLLYLSRLPKVMADDGVLPKFFAKQNARTQVPHMALMVAGGMSILFSGLSLGKLMIADMLLYALGLSLEYWALIRLRIKHPELPRPFRIALPVPGLILMCLLPLAAVLVVAVGSVMGEGASPWQLGMVGGAVVSGVILGWRLRSGRWI